MPTLRRYYAFRYATAQYTAFTPVYLPLLFCRCRLLDAARCHAAIWRRRHASPLRASRRLITFFFMRAY